MVCMIAQRSTIMALPLLFFSVTYSPPPLNIYCMQKKQKNLFTSLSYFSKTVSPWCFWFRLTVTECRSRWIIPSIQTAAIVILKEQTYVGERNVDHFKGMMKAQCWIVQKEAPMNGWGRGRKGGKEKESAFKQQIPSLSPCRFTLLILYISILCTSAFTLYISACCVNSFDFNVNVDQSIFGNAFKEIYLSGCCCSICYNRFNCPALSVM